MREGKNLSVLPPMVFHDNVDIRPVGDRVMLEVIEYERTTASGLIMPVTDRERPLMGRVIAVGEGRLSYKSAMIPCPVKAGDRVLFERFAGCEVRASNIPAVLILSFEDIMAVVTEAA